MPSSSLKGIDRHFRRMINRCKKMNMGNLIVLWISLFQVSAAASVTPLIQMERGGREDHNPCRTDDTLWITDFGAIPDRGDDSRAAIMNAVSTCLKRGGGVVSVAGGTFFCKGPLSLKSNVNLHIAGNARLLFNSDPDDYLPALFTRREGVEIYNYSPMIYAGEQENVAITGNGVIDGNGPEGWGELRSRQSPAQNRVREQGAALLPVAKRQFGKGDYLRPPFIQFINCRQIHVEGVTLTNSPFWMLHLVYCSDFVVRDATFRSTNSNNDGIDIDSSMNGLIEACTFFTGDDAIVFKSGRDQDGWRVGKATRNILVRNCQIPQALHGIAFGSELSGGIENVMVEDISCRYAKRVMQLQGLAESPLNRISFKDVSVENGETVSGEMKNFNEVLCGNFSVNGTGESALLSIE